MIFEVIQESTTLIENNDNGKKHLCRNHIESQELCQEQFTV